MSYKFKTFQKFPMWMRHPNESETGLRPVIVYDESQVSQYDAKGYVAPNMDAEFFNEVQVQTELAKQLIAIMLDSTKRSKEMGQIMYDQGQLYAQLVETRGELRKLENRVSILEGIGIRYTKALEIIRSFLNKKYPRQWRGK